MAIWFGFFAALMGMLSYFLWIKKKEFKILTQKLQHETIEKTKACEELNELKKNIALNSTKDSLTGLPSRKVFDERLTQMFHQSQRFNLLFAILFLDIDQFRRVNAAFGFEAGDEILKEVARRLQENIRKFDAVCRFNNDEFLILLSLSKPEMSAYVADRLRNILTDPFYVNQKEIYLTASIGMAVYPSDGNNENDLLIHAEQALQQAKLKGPHHIQFYQKEGQEENLRELTLISSLHSATIYNDFEIYFQPQMNMNTHSMYAVEALLYWKHEEFGLMEFNDFMQFAENSGNIITIGEWFIRNALQGFKKCEPFLPNNTLLTLTISRRQLENPHFTYKLSQVMQEMQMEPQCIVLQISEKSIFRQKNIVNKTLTMLKKLGVKMGIQQFGDGNISWHELKASSIHCIKISHVLVKNMISNGENMAMIEVMLILAKILKIDAIVDGVEHAEEIDLLKKMGCYIMQGNDIQPPKLFNDFMAEIEKKAIEKI